MLINLLYIHFYTTEIEKKVTQKELSKLASKGDYTGTTKDPATRHRQHQ